MWKRKREEYSWYALTSLPSSISVSLSGVIIVRHYGTAQYRWKSVLSSSVTMGSWALEGGVTKRKGTFPILGEYDV